MTDDDDEKSSHEPAVRALCPGMLEPADLDALRLLRLRDERGFDLAYERYAERLYGFLVRLSRSRALAEDLLQHTFLRLAEAGPGLRADSDLRAWLFAVARNAYHSHARGLGRALRRDMTLSSSLVSASASALGPESGLALAELERALGALAVEDRELLLLIGVEGLSYAEMATVLNIDAATVRKRVSRARARLAQTLDEQALIVRKSRVQS